MTAPPSITIVPASSPITAPTTRAAPPTAMSATALRFDERFWMTGGAPRGALTACVATRALASVGPRLADAAARSLGAVTVPELDGVRSGTSGNAVGTANAAAIALDWSSD